MTEPSDPATLRALADKLSDESAICCSTQRCIHWRSRAIWVIREAAASLESLREEIADIRQHPIRENLLNRAGREQFDRAEAAEALCATLRSEKAEARLIGAELRENLAEATAVCACGCSRSDHESYGEDGESCERDDHECFRTSKAALSRIAAAEASRDEALRQVEALTVAFHDTWAECDNYRNLLAARTAQDQPR